MIAALMSAAMIDVSGFVVDQSGGAVPGANVTATDSSGPVRSTVTDGTGAFRFTSLPAATYRITVERAGFKNITRAVRTGASSPPLQFVLQIADLHERISVANSATQLSPEPAENMDVVKIDRRSLRGLPTLGNDIIGTASQFVNPAAVGASGVSVIVDGVETRRLGVSASAIKEVRINENPYSAEFERPGKGRIEIITEPAEAEFHGSAQFVFRDSVFDARNAFAAVRPPEQRRIFEGHLTGPVGRSKKTRFMFTANREEQDLQNLVYAQTPGGLVQENWPHPLRTTEFSINVTRQVTDRQTLVLRYEPSRDRSRGDGVGGFTLPEAGIQTQAREDEVFLDHTATLTPGLVSQFRLRVGYESQATRSDHPGSRRVVVQDAFTGGSAQADRNQTESRVLFNQTLTWNRGKHLMVAGVSVPGFRRWGLTDRANAVGTYSFSTLAGYDAGRPFLFEVQRGNPHISFWETAFGLFVQDQIRLRPNLSLSVGLRYDRQNYIHDNNNFALRLSLAFSPDSKRKTVIRVGSGAFYERSGNGPIADLLRFDGAHLLPVILSNPSYPDPLGSGPLPAYPVSRTIFATDMRSPYLWQYSLGLERQVRKSLVATASYTGLTGIKLFRSRDANAPLPPLYLGRPMAETGVLRAVESAGRMQSHALDVSLRGSITEELNCTVQYTFGNIYTNTEGIGWFPADSYHPVGEWARANSDVRHRLRTLATYKAGDLFELGAILSSSSGLPYTITTGRDDNGDGRLTDRPAGLPRNTRQGFGLANLDLRLSREFKLSRASKDEGPTLNAGIEAFNVFNGVNYTTVIGNMSSRFFGEPVASRPARRLQLRVEFSFQAVLWGFFGGG